MTLEESIKSILSILTYCNSFLSKFQLKFLSWVQPERLKVFSATSHQLSLISRQFEKKEKLMLLLLQQKWNLLVVKGILLIPNGVTKRGIWLRNTLQKMELLQQLGNSKENSKFERKHCAVFPKKSRGRAEEGFKGKKRTIQSNRKIFVTNRTSFDARTTRFNGSNLLDCTKSTRLSNQYKYCKCNCSCIDSKISSSCLKY